MDPQKLTENAWVKLLSQIAIPCLAFIGYFSWGELQHQGEQINEILRKVTLYEWRLTVLENKSAQLEDRQKRVEERQ